MAVFSFLAPENGANLFLRFDMLTVAQAKEYLTSQGIALPDFVLELLVGQTNSINECLAKHYNDETAAMIQLYLLRLLGLAQGDRYISSQTAPSGASRSFRYQSLQDGFRGARALLMNLDTHGCATGLIPSDPTNTSRAGLWVATGGCMCER